jgi:hypothetical protein
VILIGEAVGLVEGCLVVEGDAVGNSVTSFESVWLVKGVGKTVVTGVGISVGSP